MSNINNTKEQYELNRELAQMLKGGVIMDVTNAEQAKTAGYGIRADPGGYQSGRRCGKNE
mgnify:CR=1 FL=1